MDITALNLTGALALGQRIVISVDGTVRVLEEGEPLQAGDVTLESQNEPNEPQVSVKRFSPEDGEVELDQDIANIFAALEEGEDPTELGDEFATAAGQNGSSLATSGTVERDGEETIPDTEFITMGFEALGMSRTQSLSLLEQFRFAQQEPIFVDLSFSALEDAVSASVPEDTLLSGQLTATDANNDLLTFSVESGPSNGSLTLNEDGSWQYTPDANYNGPDSFEVIVTDETGLTDTLTVTIDVTPVNDAPVAEPEDRSLLEDQVISGSINATDVDQPVGEPLVFTTDTLVEGLTLNEDGSYEFDASSYGYLSEGQELKIEVPVTVTDDQGATDTTTLTITVTGTNDLPIANADTGAVEENSTVTVDVLANDTDLDDGATFTLDNVSSDKGLATIVDNKLVFEATGEDFDHLPEGVTEEIVVTYTMSDESGEPITSTATITVTGTNDLPIANADTGAVQENSTVTVDVLANDTDLDDGATFTLDSVISDKGLATIVDNKLVFEAAGEDFDHLPVGVTEQVVVTYTMSDESGEPITSTATITVTGTNDLPIANADTGAVQENSTVTVDVLANDTDLDDDATFTLDSVNSDKGLATIVDNKLVFEATGEDFDHLPAGVTEQVVVTYIMSDESGEPITSTATITVTGTNDLPIANTDTGAVQENSTVTVDVLDNDTDLDDGATFTLDNVSSDKGLVTIVDNKLVFEATGEDFDHLPEGVTEEIVVTYTMSDESGEPITSTVTITVTGTNDRPIARNDSGSLNEDATLAVDASVGLLKNDSEIDGDNLEVIGIRTGAENASNSTAGTVGSGLTGSFGTLIVNEDGSYNYVADNADSLKAGEQVSETFTYTISDGKGGMDTATLTITVTGTNDGPKATDDSYNESSETLLFSESFEQMINTGRWTVVTGDDLGDWNATNGLEVQRDGLIADATHGDYLAELDAHKNTEISTIIDTSGQDSIRVEFDYNPRQDGNSSSDMVFKIGDTSVTVHADGTLSGANGLDIQISLPDANGWYRVTAELEVQADSTELAFAGDGASDSLGALIDNVIVTGINQPELVTREDEPITIPFAELLANDTDIDGDALSIVVGSITSEVNGTLSVDYVNETITFTPDQDYNGEATFQYTVTDGNGGEDQATVTLNITPVNDAPELNIDTGEVGEDATLTVGAGNGLLSNDSDVDGDSLNVTGILNGTTGTATAVAESGDTVISNDYGTLTIRADGSYSFVADGSDSQALATGATADVVFTYTASDGTVNQTNTLTITVTGTNDAPQLIADVGEVNEDATLTISAEDGVLANDSDVDGDSLNVTGILNGTTGTATAVVESGDTVISNDYGTLTIRADGSYSFVADGSDSQALATGATADVVFTYTASDGTVNQTNTLTITVTGTNDAPQLTADVGEVNEDATLTVSAEDGVLANDSDVDGDSLNVTGILNGTTGTATAVAESGDTVISNDYGTLTIRADGSYSFVADGSDSQALATGATADVVFTYTASDGTVNQTNTLTITVTGTNDAPQLTADVGEVNEDATLTVSAEDGVLANDSDVDGDSLNVTGILNGTTGTATAVAESGDTVISNDYGTLTIRADGSYSFVADGSDSQALATGATADVVFTYTASDGTVNQTNTLTITVTGTNDGPVAIDDTYETHSETLLFSESFENMTNTSRWTVVTGDELGDWEATNGLEIQRDGLIADATDGDYLAELDAHQNTAITTSINTSDQDSVRVEFDYNPRRDGNSSSDMTFKVGDTLVTVHADGTLSGADGLNVQIGQPDANGWYKITAEFEVQGDVTDLTFAGAGASDSYGALLDNITVTGIDAPKLITEEDQALTISGSELLANDFDVDGDDITIFSVNATDATNGSVLLIDGNVVFEPNQDFNGEATFEYTIVDTHGEKSTTTVTVNVTPVNDDPIANDDSRALGDNLIVNGSFEDYESVSNAGWGSRIDQLDGWSYDARTGALDSVQEGYAVDETDGDRMIDMEGNGDNVTLTQQIQGVESGTLYQLSFDTAMYERLPSAELEVIWNGEVVATITPESNTMQTQLLELLGGSGDGSNTLSFREVGTEGDKSGTYLDNIKFQEVIKNLQTQEDVTLDIPSSELLSNDSDVDGDTLIILDSLVIDPTYGQVELVELQDGSQTVRYTPADDFNGIATFTYTVSDGKGGTDTAVVTINVTPENDAPIFVKDGVPIGDTDQISVSTKEDNSVSGKVTATDIDDTDLTYTVSQPTNGSVEIDPETGEWKYTPNNEFDGDDSFVVTVSDGNGGTDTVVVNVDVLPVAELTVKAGQPVTEAEEAFLSFEINLNELVSENVALDLTLGHADDTATKGVDYEDKIYVKDGQDYKALSEQELADLIIASGSDSLEVFIKVLDDKLLEGEETVTLNASSTSEFVENDKQDSGTAKIVDETDTNDKDTVTVGLTGPDSVIEGDKTSPFTITLSEQVPEDSVVTLQYSYTNASNEDIVEVITVNVDANTNTATFEIHTEQDNEYEVGQEFNVSVVSVTQDGTDVFEKLDTSSADKNVAIDDSHDNPPKAEDFSISLNADGSSQVIFDTGMGTIEGDGTDHISDNEDDHDNDADTNLGVIITELPDSGTLYYVDGNNKVEVVVGQTYADPNNIVYEDDQESTGFFLGVDDTSTLDKGPHSTAEFHNWGDEVDAYTRELKFDNGDVVTITSEGRNNVDAKPLVQNNSQQGHMGFGIASTNRGIHQDEAINIDLSSRPADSVTVGLSGLGGWFAPNADDSVQSRAEITVTFDYGNGVTEEQTFLYDDTHNNQNVTIVAPEGAEIVSVEASTQGPGNWELTSLEAKASDSFEYKAVDSDGNESEVKTVTIDKSGDLNANNDPQGFEVKLGEFSEDNDSPWSAEGAELNASFNGQVGGLGAQIEYDRAEQQSEKFEINLDSPATQFTFSVSNLFKNEGNDGDFTDNHEQGSWVAYLNGVAVAGDTFIAEDGNNKGTYEITPLGPDGIPIAFDTVVFEATEYSNQATHDNDASDYFLTGFKASSEGAYAVNQGGILEIPTSKLAGIIGSELLNNDIDSDGDNLRITYVYGETEGNAYIKDGIVYFDLTGDDFVGETTFKYQITDDNGQIASAEVNVIVNPLPVPSSVASLDLLADSVVEGDELGFKVTLDSSALVESALDVTFGKNTDAANDSGDEKDLDLSQVRFTNGVTYDQQSGKLIVPIGVKDFAILIPTIDDSLHEIAETYTVTVDGESSVGSITDNDEAPTIDTVSNAVNPNNEQVIEGDVAVFTVNLVNTSSQETRFDWSLNSGSAELGDNKDFTDNVEFTEGVTLVNGQLVVPAGVTSFDIKVPTNDDGIDELNESFTLEVGGKQGIATIIDNDEAPQAQDSHVIGDEAQAQGSSITFEWADFNVSDADSSELSIVITSAPGAGDMYLYNESTDEWVLLNTETIGTGVSVSQEQVEQGFLIFNPVSYESSTSMSDEENVVTGNNQQDYAEFNYHSSDGINTSSSTTMSIDIRPDTTLAKLVVETPNVDLDEGFKLEQWENLDFDYNNGSGVAPDVVEQAIESAGAANTSEVTQTPDFGTQNSPAIENISSKLTGLVFLVAGESYVFSGHADDSFRLEVGGETMASQTWGGGGTYESSAFVPSASGWYTITAFHDNEAGPGNATISVAVGGNEPVDFNTDNFDIVPDVSSLEDKVNIGTQVEHESLEGGYYPAFDINEGLEDTFINVSKITTQLVDTDGSETLRLVVSGLPEGSIVKLGDQELVVNADGEVDISAWLTSNGTAETVLADLMIQVDEPGTYSVKIEAISDEIVGDTSEISDGAFELIVHPVPVGPDAESKEAFGQEDTILVLSIDDFGIESGNDVVITHQPLDGSLVINLGTVQEPNWQPLNSTQITSAQLISGVIGFNPDANESGYDGFNVEGVGNKSNDYAEIKFKAVNENGTSEEHTLTVDITPVTDVPIISVSLGDMQETNAVFGHPTDKETILDLFNNGKLLSVNGELYQGTHDQDDSFLVAGSRDSNLFVAHETYPGAPGTPEQALAVHYTGNYKGSDVFIGGSLDDTFKGANTDSDHTFNDHLGFDDDGNEIRAVDTVIYEGSMSDFTITYEKESGRFRVIDTTGNETSLPSVTGAGDTLYFIEQIIFSDGIVKLDNESGTSNIVKDNMIPLTVDVELQDKDGSEHLVDERVEITGIPVGVDLYIDGTKIEPTDTTNALQTFNVSVDLNQSNNFSSSIDGAQLKVTADYTGSLDFTVTAHAVAEDHNGNQATGSDSAFATFADDKLIVDNSPDEQLSGDSADDVIIGDVGGVDTTITPAKNYNIALLADLSGSMKDSFDGSTRLAVMKAALLNFVEGLDTHSGTINIALIGFASSANAAVSISDIQDNNWSTLNTAIHNLSANGATNYESAFDSAKDWFDGVGGSNANAENVTLFVTDGKPTTYTGDPGGSGGSTDSLDLTKALEAYNELSSISKVRAIGIATDSSETQTLRMFDNSNVVDSVELPLAQQVSSFEQELEVEVKNNEPAETAYGTSFVIAADQSANIELDFSVKQGLANSDIFSWRIEKLENGSWVTVYGPINGSADATKILDIAGEYRLAMMLDNVTNDQSDAIELDANITISESLSVPLGEVDVVTNANQLIAALEGEVSNTTYRNMDGDTILGGNGDDIIFGDSINVAGLPWEQVGNPTEQKLGLDGLKQFLNLKNGSEANDEELHQFISENHDTYQLFDESLGALNSVLGKGDTLDGGEGDDILYGQGGADTIIGGLGNDILTGGDDADIFKWVDGDLDGSTDRISDFSIAEGDKVDLSDLFADAPTQQQVTELLDNIEVEGGEVNSAMVVEKDGQQVKIEFDGLSAADLTNSLSDILVIKDD